MTRAQPTAEDIARATAFVDGEYRTGRDPEHHAFHRADNIRRGAMLEMGKRLETDWRVTIAVRVIHALAEALADRGQSQEGRIAA